MFLSREKLHSFLRFSNVLVTSGKLRTREGKSLGSGVCVYLGGPGGRWSRENTLGEGAHRSLTRSGQRQLELESYC